MICINTTYVVPAARNGAFRVWVRKHCIPRLAASGASAIVLSRILAETEPGHRNYSVRFDVESLRDAENFAAASLPNAQAGLPPDILHFTTLMDILYA